MITIHGKLRAGDLAPKIERMWELSGAKLASMERDYDRRKGSPVFTVGGRYTTRGWTEWTQGFEYGSRLLQFDATGDHAFLDSAVRDIVGQMASHVTHFGVHDHGFNNVSTYGNLLRLLREGRVPDDTWCRHFCELALKCSGAVQARRWTPIKGGGGYIYSFNGPHSLFADTIRSLRALGVAHQLGHKLMGENDVAVSLLDRLVQHAQATARFAVYYGEGRDSYDLRGRVAHESIFNVNDGAYRCPNSQQGYAPFSTWTRGLAWIMCGYAEQLPFLASLPEAAFEAHGGKAAVLAWMLKAATASCDFYIEHTPVDGIPYWDTGAPELHKVKDYLSRPADPFNAHEPVDSSAAAIAAQGLLRLGAYLGGGDRLKAGLRTGKGKRELAPPGEEKENFTRRRGGRGVGGRGAEGSKYWQAGLTVLDRVLSEPYISTAARHQGLILHSVYHRPNGWDRVPPGQKVPAGEACMWGDYHAREAALYVQRVAAGGPELKWYL